MRALLPMNLDAARQRFRSELGLPTEGRLVMTGHQCSIWHAGILAKYLACDAITPNHFEHAAWLWVDQDADETHTLRVPVIEASSLKAASWALKRPPVDEVAVCCTPAFSPAPFAGELALAQVREGVERIRAALIAHAKAPNAARQFAAALTDLMSPLLAPRPAAFASSFMPTSLGGVLIQRMLDNPRACVESYNRAAAGTPQARIATLLLSERDDDIELPLWLLSPGTPRVRVKVQRLREYERSRPRERSFQTAPQPGDQKTPGDLDRSLARTAPPGAPDSGQPILAPRALLMTGMARLAACDLFIHGTGGGIYDTITERWFKDWLGDDLAAPLAPTRVVTADVFLPLPAPTITEREATYARWQAAHARHDPSLLKDADAATEKAHFLGLITSAKTNGENPLPHYRAMHEMLARARERHAPALAALEHAAAHAQSALAQARLARDRTWAFPFHSSDALTRLRGTVLASA
ncbi:MAG: hypothetical protein ACKVZJ_12490 [Phycisphaerales bacterium]